MNSCLTTYRLVGMRFIWKLRRTTNRPRPNSRVTSRQVDQRPRNVTELSPERLASTWPRPSNPVAKGHLDQSMGSRHVVFEAAVRVHMLPDQRSQGAEIPCGDFSGPLGLSQNLLQHESVDVHHAILEQMQREHTDLVILAAIAGHFAMAGEEDEIVGAVPLLDDVQALVDLAAEGLIVKVPAEEDGFDRPAKFGEGLVGDTSSFVRQTALT